MSNNNHISELSIEYIKAMIDSTLDWLNRPVSTLNNKEFDELILDIYNIIDGCYFE